MKKGIYILGLFTALIVVLSGCEKKITTWDNSRITYYVDLTMLGDQVMIVPVGSSYSDPGFTAFENGVDVEDNVSVVGSVDPTSIGYYPISYSVENQDGFSKEAQRKVFVVGNSVVDLTGTYTGQREGKASVAGKITIEQVGLGLYHASDLFGGYYEFLAGGAGYGLAYRLDTYFVINDDYTITALKTDSPWGPWNVLDGVYNPETKVLSYAVEQDGFQFNATLTLE